MNNHFAAGSCFDRKCASWADVSCPYHEEFFGVRFAPYPARCSTLFTLPPNLSVSTTRNNASPMPFVTHMFSLTWIGGPSHCTRSTSSLIPNVLHKVWVGPPPLPAEDLVSLLTAALLLVPDAIHYWVTHPATQAALSCHSHLGVRFHLVNLTDPGDAFNRATADFKVRKGKQLCQHGATRRCFRQEHMSDLLRLHALNTVGGIYLDSDFFVLDAAGVHATRRCPFALASTRVDPHQPAAWEGLPNIVWTPPPRERHGKRSYPENILSPASPTMERANNGMMLGALGSKFGHAWWAYLREWDGREWDHHSCVWPLQFERQGTHRQLALISLGLRGFEDSSWPGYNSSDWQTHLKLLQDAQVSAVHLIGWTKKRPPAVAAQIGLHLLAHANAVRQFEALSGEAARRFSAETRTVCLRDARVVLATEARAKTQDNRRSIRRQVFQATVS